jgi:hypothetical protein
MALLAGNRRLLGNDRLHQFHHVSGHVTSFRQAQLDFARRYHETAASSRNPGSGNARMSVRSSAFDGAALERLRDRRFRRAPGLRVRGEAGALAFVKDVGLCSTFFVFGDGVPCLWEAVTGRARPRWPRHSHHDLAWGSPGG